MRISMRRPRSFKPDVRGATSIEYAVIAALVSLSIIGSATLIGGRMQNSFYNKIAAKLS